MNLINAGLGRTGTTSLKGALETLGISPIFHTTDLFMSSKDLATWDQALSGKPVDWRAFFAPYAAADWPAALVYRDVITAHPEAKVMLTVRDPESWFESISGTLSQILSMKLPFRRFQQTKTFLREHAINGLFEGKVDDKAHMLELFDRHIEAVRDFVPAEKLLIYDVREGWEPLCRFLEIEVPAKPFPRLNQRGGFEAMARRMFGQS